MIRWGVIGCGDVVRKRVAAAIQNESRSQLVAACRRDPERLESFCHAFGVAHRYTQADQLLANPDVDAVYIATPVRQHLPQTLAAARHGKHVLVEKPMALSVAECDQMIDACRRAGVKLGVAYYRRFYPVVHRIEQLLDDGIIGTPLAVSAVTSTPMDMLPGEEGYWRVLPADGGGGALMDVGSHRIDLFLHLFGEVSGVKGYAETVAAEYDAEDAAVAILKFRSGLVGTLQCHFGAPFDPDEFAILGTAGRLSARPLNGKTLMIETAGNERREVHPPPDNLCGPLVADFVSAILEDREPAVTGAAGRATNEILSRIYSDASTI